MTTALTSYLERLVHPARKAYAAAYAKHLLSGAAAPKVPKSLDAETAAKIARKVTRYAAAPSVDTDTGPTLADLADTLRAYAAKRADAELLGLVDAFVPADMLERQVEAELEQAAYEECERISDYYHPERTVAMIETAEVDVLDLTGLEPELARAFALKLARWNGGGKVYNYRGGRRYLNGRIRAIDLDDETVRSLPNYEDLRAVVSERRIQA